MYKLVAVDIDGTLLNSRNELTNKTKRTVENITKKGIYFVLCTGRPVQGIYDIYKELSLSSPVIAYNGGAVLLDLDKKCIYEQSLTPKDTSEIINHGRNFGTTVAVWYDSQLYTLKLDTRIYKYSEISKIEPKLITGNEGFFHEGATKVLFYDDIETVNYFQDQLKDKLDNSVNMHTSRPYFLEFVHSKVSKSLAMEKLGQYLGIAREEMIAIGDGNNDLSMIEYAGLGIAMGNAEDLLKEKADFITLSCDEDGLSYALDKFI